MVFHGKGLFEHQLLQGFFKRCFRKSWYNGGVPLQRAFRNPFVKDALTLLSKRYKQYFMCEIYPIAMFLTPKYRDFTVSRHYQSVWIIRQIVTIAIKWKFSAGAGNDPEIQ